MASLRSARLSAQLGDATKPSSEQTLAHLKCGRHGYRKHKDGTLNVTPLGSEITIARKNAQDSPLLRLPAEIRSMIWEYTVGNLVVKVDQCSQRPSAYTLTIFGLLGVCRQTYVEAAVFVSTATACFVSYTDLIHLYARGSLPLVRKIALGLPSMLIQTAHPREAILPERVRQVIRSIQSIDVTVVQDWTYVSAARVPSVRLKTEEDLRAQLDGKEVMVRHVYSWGEWRANMELLWKIGVGSAFGKTPPLGI